MKLLIETFKTTGSLHHAYLLPGEKEQIREKLLGFIEKHLEHPTKANPDFSHEVFDSFSIEDARALREKQSMKAVAYPRKIFVIETRTMTVEAQNALLKIFEEPAAATHFFIIAPSEHVFLPTLRSRLMIITEDTDHSDNDAKEFLKASVAEKMKIVGEIIEEKDKSKATSLVQGVIRELHARKTDPKLMRELLSIASYMQDRSSSLKLLLEQLVLATIRL